MRSGDTRTLVRRVERLPALGPTIRQWLFRTSLAGFLTTLCVYAVLLSAIIWPKPFLRHSATGGALSFHAAEPVPDAAADLADRVLSRLEAAPLGPLRHPVDIWLVEEEGLARRLLFSGSPGATGLTYPIATRRNVFLRHAELEANRLIRAGRVVPLPRDLEYFVVHEITHLQVARRVGRWRIARMPLWINEGFADYVALGPATPEMSARAQAGLSLPRAYFGTYPHERLCVTALLSRLRGDIDALFALDLPFEPDGACPLGPEIGIATGAVPP